MNPIYLEQIIRLRHQLHAWPELSLQEYQTKAALMKFIKTHTTLKLVDQGRWFYAFYHSPESKLEAIAFRADFDALPIIEKLPLPYSSQNPGVSHKCGHDGHSAALAGLALEINASGADRDIYFIFQHGEEIGGGGAECAGLIKEKGIAQVFAFHNSSGYPQGSIVVKPGIAHCTSRGLTISFTGTPTHASEPEAGRNPSAAIARLVLSLTDITAAKNYQDMVMATIVHITAGSKDFGIAASTGEVSVTLRAHYEQDLARLEASLRQQARTLANQEALTVSFSVHDPFPETINNERSAEVVEQAAKNLDMLFIPMKEPFRASEDFGYYLKECDGAIFFIGNGKEYPQIHTFEYDFNDQILEVAVDIFKELVLIS